MKAIILYVSISISICVAPLLCTQQCHYVKKGHDTLLSDYSNVDLLSAPIALTRLGIDEFICSVYNNPRYAQIILPHNFSHLIQLLEHGYANKLSRSYAQSTLRLFSNKMKACPYVNASAFNMLLEKLPDLLKPYYTTQQTYAIDRIKKRINNVLYAQFLEKFSTFKNDPDYFFKDLSDLIVNEIEIENRDTHIISCEEMRKTVLAFLEIGITKLMWNLNNKKDLWNTVKSLSEHMTRLLENGVLADADDLNDLYVSLIERYCYFIDLSAVDLPLDFYNTVTKEISCLSLPLLDLEEQEEHIEPKRQRLLRALTQGQARYYAYHHKEIQAHSIQ